MRAQGKCKFFVPRRNNAKSAFSVNSNYNVQLPTLGDHEPVEDGVPEDPSCAAPGGKPSVGKNVEAEVVQ